MCARPWCTTRFSPRFLNVLRFRPESFFSAFSAAPWAAGSLLAMLIPSPSVFPRQSPRFPPPTRENRRSHRLLLRDRSLAWPLARAGVGARPLAARRGAGAVPRPAERADLHEALDVHRDLLAEIPFDAARLLDHPAHPPHVVVGQILDPKVRAHPGFPENHVRTRAADAVDVGQPDLDPFRVGQVDARDTRHGLLPLSLLVLLVWADHAHHAMPAHDLALVTDPLHRRPHLHNASPR